MLNNSYTLANPYSPPAPVGWKPLPFPAGSSWPGWPSNIATNPSRVQSAQPVPTSQPYPSVVKGLPSAPFKPNLDQFSPMPAVSPAVTSVTNATPVKSNEPPNQPENPLNELSKFTLAQSGHGLKTLNFALNNITFVAAVLHGGKKIRGVTDQKLKTRPGWFEPNKFSGIWPGVYSPKMVARRHLFDTALALNCAWDSFDAFAKYSSDTGSIGSGMAAGMTEAVNQFGFNFFYAEPILYGMMNLTMKVLARLFPKSNLHQINQELADKVPKQLVKNGIPMSYRLTRSLVGGTVGILTLNGIISSLSKWVTPLAVQYLGPIIDWLYAGKTSLRERRNELRMKSHAVT